MSNTITDLRDELFATIRALRDPKNPMDVARAKAVADVAGRIIDSAKAETDFVRTFGGRSAVPASGFIASAPKADTLDGQRSEAVRVSPPALPSRPMPQPKPQPDPQAGTRTSMPPRSPMGML